MTTNLGRAALVLGVVIACAPPALAQDTQPIELGGHIRLFSDNSRVMTHGSKQEEDALLLEELGVRAHGYAYAPTFLVYDASATGGIEQAYTSVPYSFGQTYPWGYDTHLMLLPEHIVQLRAFALRREEEALSPQLDALKLVRTTRQAEGVGLDLYPFLRELPVNLDYRHEDTLTTGFGRRRDEIHDRVDGHARNVIGETSTTELRYLLDDYNEAVSRFHTLTQDVALANYLNVTKRLLLTSNVSYNDQEGDYSQSDLNASQNALFTIIPDDDPSEQSFKSNTSWVFDMLGRRNKATTYSFDQKLIEKAFLSLTTTADARYRNSEFDSGRTESWGGGIDFAYTKNLPLGALAVGYSFNFDRTTDSNPGTLFAYKESHVLKSSSSAILANPNVVSNSVTVTDSTGLTFYQLGNDFILIQRGESMELARAPTGLITEGQTVLVSYNYYVSQRLTYDAYRNELSARYSISWLSVYYQAVLLDQYAVSGTATNTLERMVDQLIGAELAHVDAAWDFKLLGEYRHVNSRITPYQSTLGDASLGIRPVDWLRLGVHASDYRVTYPYSRSTVSDSFGGNLEATFDGTAHAAFEVDYRRDRGQGSDRDIVTFLLRAEYAYHDFHFRLEGRHDMGDYLGRYYTASHLTLSIERRF